MKELTIEEKAKAYDKAIDIARSKIKNDKDHVLYEEDIIDIFPELKESEDEKMIKFIKKQLFKIKKAITENYELDAKLTKAIDWLEKQGEKSVDKLRVNDELYEHIRETCACIDDALSSKTLADINDYLSMAERSAQSAFDMIEKRTT